MYSGAVVEAGSVEQVIRSPKHPYTQLLISSIPLPDTSQRWVNLEDDKDPALVLSERETTGCRFAPRCPHAMEKCWSNNPGIYLSDEHRSVSCFLYEDQPELESADLADVFEYAA